MKGLTQLIIVSMLCMIPLTGIAGMAVLLEAEMEAVSGQTGDSIGFIVSSSDANYSRYEDGENCSGESIAKGCLQSERAFDMPIASAENIQNIGNLPLKATFTDIPDRALGKNEFEPSKSKAGATCCSIQLYTR